MISFKATREDYELINSIADRAVTLARDLRVKYAKQEATMDLTACHANGMPLNLSALLAADDATFGHDVFGIRRYIDRSTGQITKFFVPRTAHPQYANT